MLRLAMPQASFDPLSTSCGVIVAAPCASSWHLGVEYDYWWNKYGIKDTDAFPTTQHAISLLVKSHF